jgi:hypothetical protein
MHGGRCRRQQYALREEQVAAAALLEQARLCRRLARSIYTQATAAELEAYARQLEECARLLEGEKRSPDGAASERCIGSSSRSASRGEPPATVRIGVANGILTIHTGN